MLAPLRLSALGFGAVAIGAVFLCSAALEAVNNVLLGHASDRLGPVVLLAAGLVASIVVSALLPWPDRAYVLALLVVCAGLAFGTFFTPGMTLLSNLAETRGLHYGYAAALINLAWAPGQTIGAAGGGALAQATSDAVPYLLLSAVCVATLVLLRRARRTPGWARPKRLDVDWRARGDAPDQADWPSRAPRIAVLRASPDRPSRAVSGAPAASARRSASSL